MSKVIGTINGKGFAVCPVGGYIPVNLDKLPQIEAVFEDVDKLCDWLKEQAKAGPNV